jgi:hypothetical protein
LWRPDTSQKKGWNTGSQKPDFRRNAIIREAGSYHLRAEREAAFAREKLHIAETKTCAAKLRADKKAQVV